jgi:hypothetical protein
MELDELLPEGSETSLQHLPDLMDMEWEDTTTTTSATSTLTATSANATATSPTQGTAPGGTAGVKPSSARIGAAKGTPYIRNKWTPQPSRAQELSGAATQASLLAEGTEGEGGAHGSAADQHLHLFLVLDTCVLLNPHAQSLLRSLQAHFAPGARKGSINSGEGGEGVVAMDTGRQLRVSVLVPRRVLSELDGIKVGCLGGTGGQGPCIQAGIQEGKQEGKQFQLCGVHYIGSVSI